MLHIDIDVDTDTIDLSLTFIDNISARIDEDETYR
jgi:hypothetical protein